MNRKFDIIQVSEDEFEIHELINNVWQFITTAYSFYDARYQISLLRYRD